VKNKIVLFTLSAAIIAASFNASGQQNAGVEKARKNEAKAQHKLELARLDSAEDFRKFKEQSEKVIAANEQEIIKLKTNKTIGSKEANKKYDKRVLALEKKNNELKKKIEECDDTKTSMWTSFKRTITNSLEDLGCAMKNVGTCDTK
jgi:hypothetical protein